jgi:hypothetical protein
MYEYATVAELEARWRPLTPVEQTKAAILLDDASAKIRTTIKGIDARLDADDDLRRNATRIVCAMVQRAMDAPDDAVGVATVQETVGPFSRSFNYANPIGDLYLRKEENGGTSVRGWVPGRSTPRRRTCRRGSSSREVVGCPGDRHPGAARVRP